MNRCEEWTMIRRARISTVICCVVILLLAAPACEERARGDTRSAAAEARHDRPPELDPDLPIYEVKDGVSGRLRIVGSDTLERLLTLWAQEFNARYPAAEVTVEGQGSATAPPALIGGHAELGSMSREMNAEEAAAFVERFGRTPSAVPVALDALAVYVHEQNPIDRMKLEQLDAIFSSTRNCGHPEPITTWGQLGLTGEWADAPIRLYGRDPLSGTRVFFAQRVLCDGEFRDEVNERDDSPAIVREVTADRFGIGYAGIGYQEAGVKTIALARGKKGFHYATDTAEVYGSRYPLSRLLYVYVGDDPREAGSNLVHEFLEFGLSKDGQRLVVEDGFVPLPGHEARWELSRLPR
jgi:phosphate transport system substrate-binding protein